MMMLIHNTQEKHTELRHCAQSHSSSLSLSLSLSWSSILSSKIHTHALFSAGPRRGTQRALKRGNWRKPAPAAAVSSTRGPNPHSCAGHTRVFPVQSWRVVLSSRLAARAFSPAWAPSLCPSFCDVLVLLLSPACPSLPLSLCKFETVCSAWTPDVMLPTLGRRPSLGFHSSPPRRAPSPPLG